MLSPSQNNDILKSFTLKNPSTKSNFAWDLSLSFEMTGVSYWGAEAPKNLKQKAWAPSLSAENLDSEQPYKSPII